MSYQKLIKVLAASVVDEYFESIAELLNEIGAVSFCILKFENNLSEIVVSKNIEGDLFFDSSDIQFDKSDFKEDVAINYFDKQLKFDSIFYIHHNSSLFAAILINISNKTNLNILKENIERISQRYLEILIKDKRTEVYVEYQKKIDFVKVVSNIFRNLSIDDLLSTGVALFMDVFSAEASCVLYGDKFVPIGVKEDDLAKITVKGEPLSEIIYRLDKSYFFKEDLLADKYNVENIFFIYEPKYKLRIILFNVSVDFAPDVEFSEIISSILTIAMENAYAHEKMVEMKVYESEMDKTAEILNMFVNNEIVFNSEVKAYGVSIPAKVAGGDFLYLTDNEDEIFLCIADVCGKGYAAAVLTVVMSTVAELLKNVKHYDLVDLTNKLSDFLLSKNLGGRFITLFFGVIDKKSLELKYISLGHEPAYIVRDDAIIELHSSFLPMGIMKEEYGIEKIKLSNEDLLFLFTDGIIEYIDYENLKYRLMEIKDTPLEDFVKNLYKECVKDRKQQLDDFTCAVLKI
ncbi:serine/threonine-protein phosphatase [Deferribacteraceae bacterium V6Fe1]|nr:serine/threonine-protein phosphatase [Deferribacteraceae bacterium V6Fe1]